MKVSSSTGWNKKSSTYTEMSPKLCIFGNVPASLTILHIQPSKLILDIATCTSASYSEHETPSGESQVKYEIYVMLQIIK